MLNRDDNENGFRTIDLISKKTAGRLYCGEF